MTKVGVLGLGSFGYALLKHLDRKKTSQDFTLTGYARNTELVSQLERNKTHPLFPKASPLSDSVSLTDDFDYFFNGLDIVVLAVPSSGVEQVLKECSLRSNRLVHIINTTKALHPQTGRTFSDLTSQIWKGKQYTYTLVAGANLASELVEGKYMEMHGASVDETARNVVSTLLESPTLRVIPTADLVGVEYAAAFKNVISLLSGIVYGKKLAEDRREKIIKQARKEAETLIVKELKGDPATFTDESPSWGQDLRLSCYGKTRNRHLGVLLGQGYSREEALDKIGSTTLEGINTALALPQLTELTNYPLLSFLYNFLSGSSAPSDTLEH